MPPDNKYPANKLSDNKPPKTNAPHYEMPPMPKWEVLIFMHVHKFDPCMQNTEEIIEKYTVDANLFRLGSINPKKKIQPLLFFQYSTKKLFLHFFFKSVQIYRKLNVLGDICPEGLFKGCWLSGAYCRGLYPCGFYPGDFLSGGFWPRFLISWHRSSLESRGLHMGEKWNNCWIYRPSKRIGRSLQ